jgi:hypothetical protein
MHPFVIFLSKTNLFNALKAIYFLNGLVALAEQSATKPLM